jgi:hypothetical protein
MRIPIVTRRRVQRAHLEAERRALAEAARQARQTELSEAAERRTAADARRKAEREEWERRYRLFVAARHHGDGTAPGGSADLDPQQTAGRDEYIVIMRRYYQRASDKYNATGHRRDHDERLQNLDDLPPALAAYVSTYPEIREALDRTWPYERARRARKRARWRARAHINEMIAARTHAGGHRAEEQPDLWLYYVEHIRLPWLQKIGIGNMKRIAQWERQGWRVLDKVRTQNAYRLEQDLLRQIHETGARTTTRLHEQQTFFPDGYSEWFDSDDGGSTSPTIDC